MMINISAQYNRGFLPDIILLIQGYYHWGIRLIKYNVPGSGFVFTAYIITTVFDGVLLHCFCFVFTVFLVSLHGD